MTPGLIMKYSESVGVYLLQWAVCGILSALGSATRSLYSVMFAPQYIGYHFKLNLEYAKKIFSSPL